MSDTLTLQVVFTAMMALAAIHDLTTERIPHMLSAWLIILYLVVASRQSDPTDVVAAHLGVAAGVFALLYILAMMGPIGGGDLYFATAISFWIGSLFEVFAWIILSLVLFVMMMGFLVVLRLVDSRLFIAGRSVPAWLDHALDRRRSLRRTAIPAALPMAAAAVLWVWS